MRDMEAVFSPDGALSHALDGYSYREGQLKMADMVDKSFRTDTLAVIEAGTGIGKSFAYLVPSLMFAAQPRLKLRDHDRHRVVIATGTINLMAQLYDRDVRLLQLRLGLEGNVAMLCGRANYLCIRRWRDLLERQEELNPAERSVLESLSGELSDDTCPGLRFRFEAKVDDRIWSNLCADGDFCTAPSCPYLESCFFYKAKADAKKADIVVTNHSLLCSDARIKQDAKREKRKGGDLVLPNFKHLVVDEAHALAEHALHFYESLYDPLAVESLLSTLATKEGGIIRTLALNALGENDTLHELLLALTERAGDGTTVPVEKAKDLPDGLWDTMHHLSDDLGPVCAELEKMADESANYASIAQHMRRTIHALGNAKPKKGEDEMVRSLSLSVWGKRRRVTFSVAPFEVGDQLREDVWQTLDSGVATSATLSTGSGHDFSYWMRRVGLDPKLVSITPGSPLFVPSPYDYDSHMLVLAACSGQIPRYVAGHGPEWDDAVAKAVLRLVAHVKGGVMVLLASYGDLYSLLERIGEGDASDWRVKGTLRPLFFQGELPRSRLTDLFREAGNGILLGTHSFWEGVDVPGDALSLVIIPRIPFRNVKDPYMRKLDRLGKERERKLMADLDIPPMEKKRMLWKESPFNSTQLPYASLMLRQGLGRLIRGPEDRGVAVLLDERLVSYSYGRQLLGALPSKARVVTVDDMLAMIDRFMEAGA